MDLPDYPWFPPLERLYAGRRPIDPKRIQFQGDVFDDVISYRFRANEGPPAANPRSTRGPVMLLDHPCDISEDEKGAQQPWRTICPVAEDRQGVLSLDGETHFYAFPLPDLRLDDSVWYADFRFATTVHVDILDPNSRLSALSEDGWYALQRRLAHHRTRVVIHWSDLLQAGEGDHPDAH
jgi:hypothetical protein